MYVYNNKMNLMLSNAAQLLLFCIIPVLVNG